MDFLLDEHIPLVVQARLRQMAPEVSTYAIGGEDAPPKGTPDADVLRWIEAHDCVLVTANRATIPQHLRAHLCAGGHVPGIVQVSRQMSIRAVLDDLLLICGAGLEGEFQDQIIYLPLRR